MPMGLNISPSIWQSYINVILDCLQSRRYCEVIMDDLLLFTPSNETHMNKLEDLLKALLKNGLKISPKKCQLFKTSLQYMGKEIFIENKNVCMKPLRSRLEAIQKLQPPKTPKGCRSFAGVVNFLSMFCPGLQKILKPIYDLSRKGRPFVWGKEQQDSFEEISADWSDHQFYICQIKQEGSIYTQTLANLQLVAHCIRYKMVNLN